MSAVKLQDDFVTQSRHNELVADQILDALDPEQRRVATLLDEPVVVLAGAGTGKTRAITHRIAHAISVGAYQATACLAVTFTARAAGEMRTRLDRLGVAGLQARTIHAAALRQCQYFWPTAFGSDFPPVADNSFGMVARATATVLKSSETALIRDLTTEISWAKSANISAEDYEELCGSRSVAGAEPRQVAAVFERYEAAKTAAQQVDFDDILLCNAALLTTRPEVAARIQETYRHFVVDEYQDVSAVQHRLISLWVGERNDFCVVGDPDQSIHSFAGASPRFLLGLAKQATDDHVVRLRRNYRSSPQIISVANQLLGRTSNGLVATQPDCDAPTFSVASADDEEIGGVVDWLGRQHNAGSSWDQLAVLYRINAQAPALEAALASAGIPYTVRGADRFYERQEIRAALNNWRKLEDMRARDALTQVLSGLGWTKEPPAGQGSQREKWESWQALFELVETQLRDEPEMTSSDCLTWLAQQAAWQAAPVANAVSLSTMHAAKGLEWDGVALIGIREGLMPFASSQDEPELSEERRLLYVAVTRARRQLRISWTQKNNKPTRSRFIARFVDKQPRHSSAPKQSAKRSGKRCLMCGKPLATIQERRTGRHDGCDEIADQELFDLLRAWRMQRATSDSVPAFVVFSDSTLVALAQHAPKTRVELLRIPGIGAVKADKYGAETLALIKKHKSGRLL